MKMINLVIYPPNIKQQVKGKYFLVFGFGEGARNLLSFLEPLKPVLILDNDRHKQGETYKRVPTVSPKIIKNYNGAIIIISTLNFHVAIYDIIDKVEGKVTFLIPDPSIIYGFK